VLVKGHNFDVSLGGIFCKFGSADPIAASIINLEDLIMCEAPALDPPTLTPTPINLEISVDNMHHFFTAPKQLIFV